MIINEKYLQDIDDDDDSSDEIASIGGTSREDMLKYFFEWNFSISANTIADVEFDYGDYIEHIGDIFDSINWVEDFIIDCRAYIKSPNWFGKTKEFILGTDKSNNRIIDILNDNEVTKSEYDFTIGEVNTSICFSPISKPSYQTFMRGFYKITNLIRTIRPTWARFGNIEYGYENELEYKFAFKTDDCKKIYKELFNEDADSEEKNNSIMRRIGAFDKKLQNYVNGGSEYNVSLLKTEDKYYTYEDYDKNISRDQNIIFVYIDFNIPKGTTLNRYDVLYDIRENFFTKFSTNFLSEHTVVFVCSSSKQTKHDKNFQKPKKEYKNDFIRDGYFIGIINDDSIDEDNQQLPVCFAYTRIIKGVEHKFGYVAFVNKQGIMRKGYISYNNDEKFLSHIQKEGYTN